MAEDEQDTLHALSVRQPWAWAIVEGWKDVENRRWTTRRRGTVAVHAAWGMTQDEYDDFVRKAASIDPSRAVPAFEDLARGAIVGLVDVVACVEGHESPWFTGPFGFVLANSRTLREPIPCKGALSFWRVPDDVARRVING
jgi:hypothetical protein